MDGNPYAPPVAGMTNQKELRRIVRRRAALAAAIDGMVFALLLDVVPVFVFGLAWPRSGILDGRWLIGIGLTAIYSAIFTATGTGLGGLLTRTRESRQDTVGATVLVTLVRTFWPLPFAVLGVFLAGYVHRSLYGFEATRPELMGIPFVFGPWVLPFVAWFFVRIQRDTWRLSETILLERKK